MPPRVALLREVLPEGWAALQAEPWEVTLCEASDRDSLRHILSTHEAVISTLSHRIDASLMAEISGGPLKIIANHGVGYENLDVAAIQAAGIWATHTPDVLTEATAEMAWALLLNLARRIGEGERLVRSGQWQGWAPNQLLGTGLRGKTLGIVGCGRIGQAFGRIAHFFGMRLTYFNRSRQTAFEQATGAISLPLEELLAQADVVSLHLPANAESYHLLNRRRLQLLKPTALLVNTGRGTAIEEAVLVKLLKAGHLGGAALDVYEYEPKLSDGLTELENVVLAPHLGSATRETRLAMLLCCRDNIRAVLMGEKPPNPCPIPLAPLQ